MDITSYILSKKYVDATVEDTLAGAGALKGAPCQIQSIEPVAGGNNITFLWKLEDGTTRTSTVFVKDGLNGEKGKDGLNGKDGKDGKDGLNGRDGVDGQPGRDGLDGKDGENGKDGADGKDGYTPVKGVDYFDGTDGAQGEPGYTPIKGIDYFDGANGVDGVGIENIETSTEINDGVVETLITIYLSNGNQETFTMTAERGVPGKDGINGADGKDGKDGKDGIDGVDGATPEIGENGNWIIDGVDTGKVAAPDLTNYYDKDNFISLSDEEIDQLCVDEEE